MDCFRTASYFWTINAGDPEKLSPYECGFEPFDDARNTFDIRFYLVAILFILFDLEATFLFPWATSLSNLTNLGFWSMFDFIFELVIGFIYAWKIGSLEWFFKLIFSLFIKAANIPINILKPCVDSMGYLKH